MIHIDNWNIVVGFIHIHLYNIMRKEGRKKTKPCGSFPIQTHTQSGTKRSKKRGPYSTWSVMVKEAWLLKQKKGEDHNYVVCMIFNTKSKEGAHDHVMGGRCGLHKGKKKKKKSPKVNINLISPMALGFEPPYLVSKVGCPC